MFGAKPSPESMVTSCQWDQILVKFVLKYNDIESNKYI